MTDFVRIQQRVKDLRLNVKPFRVKADNPLVGAAINQAMAQLKQNAVDMALETIAAAEKRCPAHPDLLTMRARCLLKTEPPRADEARRIGRRAYEAGSRKEVLFDIWYEAEWMAGHYNGAVEVCECALEGKVEPDPSWFVRRAAALWHIAKDQERAGNVDRAVADYRACEEDLNRGESKAEEEDVKEFRRYRFVVHDAIWNLFSRSGDRGVDSATQSIDELRRAIRAGDFRITTYLRLCEALGWLIAQLEKNRRVIKKGLRNLVEQRMREVRKDIDEFVQKRKDDTRVSHLIEQWECVDKAYNDVMNRLRFAN